MRAHQRMPAARTGRDAERGFAPAARPSSRRRAPEARPACRCDRRERSQTHRALDAGHAVAADPDVAARPAPRARARRGRAHALRGDIARRRRPSPINHCARAAFRLPVTGSSATPSTGWEEGAHLERSSCPPAATTPLRPYDRPDPRRSPAIAARVGPQCQHRRGLRSITARQPGPLSQGCWRRCRCDGTCRKRAMRSTVGLVERPAAAQRRRGEGQPRTVAADAHQAGAAFLHAPRPGAAPPAASQAWQLPSVGWPAKGSSRRA